MTITGCRIRNVGNYVPGCRVPQHYVKTKKKLFCKYIYMYRRWTWPE